MSTRSFLALVLSTAACAGSEADPTPADPVGGTLAVQVGALETAGEFEPIASAIYDLVITYFDPIEGWVDLVVESGISSSSSNGSMVFIAPCQTWPDGSDRPGQVTVTITSVMDGEGEPIADAELPPGQTQQFNCKLEQDVLVPFHFTVLRSANRGFVDLMIDIDDVLCSAKFDCPPALLFDDQGVPGPTLVTGLSCRGVGPDTSITFTGQLVCFDDEGIPSRPSPKLEVFTGFEEASGQAFHNTATLLDDAFMADFERCEYRATGLPSSRGGGPRDAKFRQGVGAIEWGLDIRIDELTGLLTCGGKVGPAYIDVRSDEAATPRDGAIRPTRAAPIEEKIHVLDNKPRRFPDCGPQEAAASESKAFLRASLLERSQIVQAMADLEAGIALAETVAADVAAAGSSLVVADVAAADDANAPEVMNALESALVKTNGVPAAVADKAKALEAIWVLIDDADRNLYDIDHHATARAENEALGAAVASRLAQGESALAARQSELGLHDAKQAETLVRHSQTVDSMEQCRDGQRERKAIAFVELESTFPWAQGAVLDPVVSVDWVSVVDSAGRLQDAELVSACAYGNPDSIERIVTQVRTWNLLDPQGERGYLHFIREAAPFKGYACIGSDGNCDLFPETEIPCAYDNAVAYDADGGYIVGE